MSYEMMEALLVQKIATIRQSEAMIARTLGSNPAKANVTFLNAAQKRMYSEIEQVELLLSAMDTVPATDSLAALLPIDSAPQITSSAWV